MDSINNQEGHTGQEANRKATTLPTASKDLIDSRRGVSGVIAAAGV
jgi:hypothetical protein